MRTMIAAMILASAAGTAVARPEQHFTTVFPLTGDTFQLGFLPRFDPSLGTLQQVQLDWRAEVTREVLVSHDTRPENRILVYDDLGADVQFGAPNVIINSLVSNSVGLVIPGNTDGPTNFFPGDLVHEGLMVVNPIDHPLYTGDGNFNVPFSSTFLANVDFFPDGVSAAAATLKAGGFLTVTYTYIPAPGAAALLGLGGLAASRRRR